MERTLEPLELEFDSELPTHKAPERAAVAARLAARALMLAERKAAAEEAWCDSEAPTGVVIDKPLFPRPPRAPRL